VKRHGIGKVKSKRLHQQVKILGRDKPTAGNRPEERGNFPSDVIIWSPECESSEAASY
jgi:hypothetical protein